MAVMRGMTMIQSSSSSDMYEVTSYDDARFTCTCPFGHHKGPMRLEYGTCKHVRKYVERNPELRFPHEDYVVAPDDDLSDMGADGVPIPDLSKHSHLQGLKKGSHICLFGGPQAGCYQKNLLPVNSYCVEHIEYFQARKKALAV